MSIVDELKALYHLTLSPIRGKSHAERLESFYSGQAKAYDQFRRHLLKGRAEMYADLPLEPGDIMVEMGAGTGQNLEFLGERVSIPRRIYLVDLSASLLEVARQRIKERGWTNVEVVEADATRYTPPEGKADVVTFSYSLTMIPDWFAAIDHAKHLLVPGGRIGVADFFVARKYPDADRVKHRWGTRTFWRTWFDLDNVFLSPDHIPYLRHHFDVIALEERRSWMRYLPGTRVPYYWFVGRKKS